MIMDIIENDEYKDILCAHSLDIIKFFIYNRHEFSITANIKGIEFNPPLPDPIMAQMKQFSLFVLANYTFETLEVHNDCITFEASFGKEHFVSNVTIELIAIFQIIIDESIFFINPISAVQKYFNQISPHQRSINSFKINPNNQLFFRT